MFSAPTITYIIFLIFAGTAFLSTLALYTRQSLLVAYIALGMLFGPWGLKLVNNSHVIKQTGDIGIIFLLFLLGLHLQPQNLFHSVRKMSLITLGSSLLFFMMGFALSCVFGYTPLQCLIIGIATMFSSTIIGIKLLPTSVLHHQHTGELLVSILLLQDIIAIAAILLVETLANKNSELMQPVWLLISAFPALLIAAYLIQRFILTPLLTRFDKIHEYIFILSIGWCLCMAELSHMFGLSEEIGAFIAGVALASNPIAFYIAENLKPLRDFFLIIFFFTIGASFNFTFLPSVIWPALALAGLALIGKPLIFSLLLKYSGETKHVSKEIGIRLGQMSEFSLLLTAIALEKLLLNDSASYMLQAAVILTFIVSCYWTVLSYPTPMAMNAKLMRD